MNRPGKSTAELAVALLAGVIMARVVVDGTPAIVAIILAVAAVIAFGTLVTRAIGILAAATAVVAFATTPGQVPSFIAVGPTGVHVFEPFLAALVIRLYLRDRSTMRPGSPSPSKAVVWLCASVLVGVLIGLVRGFGLHAVVFDSRPLVHVALGAYAASKLRTDERNKVVAVLPWLLGSAAALMVVASVTGLELSGRSETPELYRIGGGYLTHSAGGATRFITPTTSLALVTLVASACLLLLGVQLKRPVIRFIGPALVIVGISFSRNIILGVSVGLLVGLLGAIAAGRGGTYINRLMMSLPLACVLAIAMSPLLLFGPVSVWVGDQAEGYEARVLGGLDRRTQALDTSTQDRIREDRYLLDAISQSPILGKGAGFPYKPAEGPVGGFAAGDGRLYAHNFYLWLWAKYGAFGVLAFATLVGSALIDAVRRIHRRDALGAAMPGVIIAVMVVSIFAPYPEGYPTAVLVGGLVGGVHFRPAGSLATARPGRIEYVQ